MSKLIALKELDQYLKNGITIMVGGFLTNGSPNTIMEYVANSKIESITLVCNDAAYANQSFGKLISNRQVKRIITSYVGTNIDAVDQMNNFQLDVEFSPQGTLVERIRSGGAGLGGVLTPTGLGTVVERGKKIIEVEGKSYILELPLRADIAFIKSSIADSSGNLYYKGNSRNFNPIMAMAADLVIAESDLLVPAGEIKPEEVHTPS
ncbi:MAG: 3-oxoacid CoA-transferase subunit A, partial [Bacteroidales bacterium]